MKIEGSTREGSTIKKSSIDDREYSSYLLPNGIRILTIFDPKADKAGCALSVNVGSYDEPGEIEGLAHFLEHMLFMGTKEYPEENAYMDFLSRHNGSSNAFTSNENTVYYFDVGLEYFEEALKMFSSFFKTPLFLKGSIDREISAVNSEFLNGRCNDTWRIFRMVQLCCKEGLPESHFNVGNNETLRVEKIHEKVKKFWEEKYLPEKMCVVLYSNKKDSYSELFMGIPKNEMKHKDCENNSRVNDSREYNSRVNDSREYNSRVNDNMEYNSKENDSMEYNSRDVNSGDSYIDTLTSLHNLSFYPTPDIFKGTLTNRIIQVDPIKDQKTLVISIVVPSEYKYLEVNPYIYIDHLFSREDNRGFVGRVKDKGLAFYAGFDLDSYSKYSLLQITISLTLKGLSRVEEILKMVEEYFSDFEYSEEEYLKIRDLKDLQFTYREMDDPIDCVESISEIMQYVPVENVFDHSYTLRKWNEGLLRYIISCISDRSKWLIFLLNKEGDFNKRDELYDVKYKVPQ